VLQARKAKPDIRARRAAPNWVVLLAQPDKPARLARRVQWARPVLVVLSVKPTKAA